MSWPTSPSSRKLLYHNLIGQRRSRANVKYDSDGNADYRATALMDLRRWPARDFHLLESLLRDVVISSVKAIAHGGHPDKSPKSRKLALEVLQSLQGFVDSLHHAKPQEVDLHTVKLYYVGYQLQIALLQFGNYDLVSGVVEYDPCLEPCLL